MQFVSILCEHKRLGFKSRFRFGLLVICGWQLFLLLNWFLKDLLIHL